MTPSGKVTVERWLDEAFSARWWWRMRRYLAEKQLERILEAFGEKSIAARNATERFREMQFAVTYYRAAPGPVREIVREARRSGVPIEDLQLIVLNTDLRFRDSRVSLRCSALARMLSAAMATVVGVHWTLLCTMVAFAPGPLLLKAVVLLLLLIVYAVLYRGWTLYAYRPLEAERRSGLALRELCAKATVSGVRDLHANEN